MGEQFLRHESCENCGSSDGKGVYANGGGTYCFVCKHSTQDHTHHQPERLSQRDWSGDMEDIAQLDCTGLEARGISKEVAAKFGVKTEFDVATGEELAYYFPLYNQGKLVGYQKKIARCPGGRQKRDVSRIGDTKGVIPFGGHLSQNGGRFLIVVEGGEDALAASQMLQEQGKNYRVVATMGTDGWKKQLDWLEAFEKVVICFDPDKAGEDAARGLAEALGEGKAHIAYLPLDPNEMLLEGQAGAFLKAVFDAKPYESGGIIWGEEAWDAIKDYTAPESIPYPPEFEILNRKLGGMRKGEISLWTSGTGCGKSAFVRRIKQHVIQSTNWKLGDVELEHTKQVTIRSMLQFQGNKRLTDMSEEEKRAAWEATYGTNRLFTVDRRCKLGKKSTLLGQLKALHYGKGCDIIMLDHITLAQDEMGDGKDGLAAQDKMMVDLLDLAESTNVHICLISHLRKSPGGNTSFEEGAMPSLDDLKGSGSIKQISADIIALGRNLQHPDPYYQNVTKMRVLKNREEGNVGAADAVFYNKDTYSFETAVLEQEESDE